MNIEENYTKNLQALIQCETISYYDGETDIAKFREFHKVFKNTFPNICSKCSFEDFDGSFLMKWEGQNKNLKPILFLDHHDVVEATGSWKYPPFSATISDGKMYGRGTLDDKEGLWAFMQSADDLAKEGFIPSRDFYFLSSCNEETTGDGCNHIVSVLEERGIEFEMSFDEGGMILPDPVAGTDNKFAIVGLGEKGCCDIKFIARSNGGHASTPAKNSPLVRLGKFMNEVEKKNPFRKEFNPVIREFFKRLSPYMGATGIFLKHNKLFDGILKILLPKLSESGKAFIQTTLAFTRACGADGNNVMPQEAWVIGNMRFAHHQDREDSINAIKPIADKYDIEIEILDPGVESGITDCNSEAFKLVEKAVKATRPDVKDTLPYIMFGASDSRYIDRICKQCIRFLPFSISDEQYESIHGLNENVDLSNLVPAVNYYKYIMTNL